MKPREKSLVFSVYEEAMKELRAIAAVESSIIVAFSGGKDSRVVLDLCHRAGFKTIVGFYMYLVPGLECEEEKLQWARDRYGITILQYPHWVAIRCLQSGAYCPPRKCWGDTGKVTVDHIHGMVQADTGIRHIAHGAKLADSLWRRRNMAVRKNKDDGVVYPLRKWKIYDVLAYLNMHNIPRPDFLGDNKAASGLGLMTEEMCWLHDTHPADFRRVMRWFPYVEAIIYRREWFGIGK